MQKDVFGYIYKITCIPTGLIYVGKTQSSIEDRYYHHWYSATHGVKSYLYNAMRKYGRDNFKIEELAVCYSKEELEESEIYLIDKFNCRVKGVGYNLAKGGTGGDTLSARSDEAKAETSKKLSNSLSGENNPAYGKHWWTNGVDQILDYECPEGWWPGNNDITRENHSKSQKGIRKSDTAKEKYRQSKLGDKNPMKKRTGDNHPSAGKKCYINADGTESHYYIPGTEPEGWVRGMRYKSNRKKRTS